MKLDLKKLLRRKEPQEIPEGEESVAPASRFLRRKKPRDESTQKAAVSVFSFLRRKHSEADEDETQDSDDTSDEDGDDAPGKNKKASVSLAQLKRRIPKPKRERGEKRASYATTRGAKYVIFLGDDGAILIYAKGKNVLSRQFVPDAEEESLKEFRETLAEDPKAPLFLVIDNMDQVFIQQTLPPVSSLGVGKLIKRRLDRDFGANDIKGALLLGREKTGRRDWNFLMISVERTTHIGTWLDFIAELPHQFAGIHLLSIEAENIVSYLDGSLPRPTDAPASQWKFFVSHNKVGGFRQVILRDGRIIFTRMTQPIGESTPEIIAGNIEQEINGTIEYMKRLGFSPQAGLDIYVITSNSVREVLDLAKANARASHILTPNEAAQLFAIEGAAQPGDQFGDVIMAACIGCAKKHVLTFSTPYFKQLSSLYQMITLQRGFAVLSIVGAFIYMGIMGYDFYTSYQQIEDLTVSKRREETSLVMLKDEVTKTNLDIEKISDTIDLYQEMLAQKTSPAPFLRYVAKNIKLAVPIRDISWSLDTSAPDPKKAKATKAKAATDKAADLPRIAAVFTLEFVSKGDDDELIKLQSEKALQAFKDMLPEYEVAYDKPVLSSRDDGNVSINFGKKLAKQKTAGAQKEKIILGQVVVKGAIMLSPEAQEKAAAKEAGAKTDAKTDAVKAVAAPAAPTEGKE